MPKSFNVGEERVHISRPGQRLATHTQPLTADSQVVTHREGPRTIRTRQRVQRAARRAAAAEPSPAASAARPIRCSPTPGAATPRSAAPIAGSLRWGPAPGAAAPVPAPGAAAPGPPAPDSRVPGSFSRATGTRPPVSPELQALEATVAGSRHSSTDRRGLGSVPGRQTASAGQTRFTQASPVAQPQDMDCSPPMGATVLPPLRQCDSMDADDPEPQAAQPLISGVQPMDVCAPPQLSEDVRDELMHWMDAHTALSIPQRGDALARLYAAQPGDFTAQPLPQRIYAALHAIDEAETQRQRAVDPPMRRRSPSPAVPPGFEASVAARTAVTAAMTGLRRSSRTSTRPTDWWTTSQPQPSGRPASCRRPGQP